MAQEVEIVNFEDLPLAFEARREALGASADQKVKDAIESFERTAIQLAVLPAK